MASETNEPVNTAGEEIAAFVSSSESFRTSDSEVVIGLVGPTAADLKHVSSLLTTFLEHPLGYKVKPIKITEKLAEDQSLKPYIKDFDDKDYNAKINALMNAGNELRDKSGRSDFLALVAIKAINEQRVKTEYQSGGEEGKDNLIESEFKPRHAYIVHQFKHPDEVRTFRKVYGPGFYLIGVHTSYTKRLERFMRLGVPQEEAEKTLLRDLEEDDDLGQHTRDTFALADAFITTERLPEKLDSDIMRILEIIFGNPYETPSRDEYCMFLAYAASLRSADLSRQVGAVLVSEKGDITATGSNEVARSGGGQYWPGDDKCCRDYERGEDSNERERQGLIDEIKSLVADIGAPADLEELDARFKSSSFWRMTEDEDQKKLLFDELKAIFVDLASVNQQQLGSRLRSSSLWNITEYGRSIHAEMEAILSSARAGISTRNGVLYTTTFPCHNCAKHIVDAGINRVVFVEPYPKSRAPDLLSDSINIVGEASAKKSPDNRCKEISPKRKVQFEPFIGISARRFVDLFSMHLTTGEPRKRKTNGKPIPFSLSNNSDMKVPMMPNSYLQRELTSGLYYEQALDKLGITGA